MMVAAVGCCSAGITFGWRRFGTEVPEWTRQSCCRPTAALLQPGCLQRMPPPCAAQCWVRPRATFSQPKVAHFRPPPWRTQYRVDDCADLLHPSCSQRRPPPCAVHSDDPPTADLLQSGLLQRLPPPWAAQKNLSRAPRCRNGQTQQGAHTVQRASINHHHRHHRRKYRRSKLTYRASWVRAATASTVGNAELGRPLRALRTTIMLTLSSTHVLRAVG